MTHFVSLLLILGSLSGCSLFADKDNSEPPARLESFEKQVQLVSLWGRDTGEGTREQRVKLVPAVSGERVYAADRNGSVLAYELDSGKQVWRSKTGLAISAGVGVGDGLVLVGSSEAELVALDSATGDEVWRTSVSSEVLSIPQASDGVVIVQTVDGNIAGLDASDGKRLWVRDRSAPVLTLRGTSTPLVVENVVLAGFASGKMTALEIQSGRQIWEVAVAVSRGRSELQRIVDIDADAVVRDGVLYVVSFQGRLVAISLQDGRMLWNRDMSAYAGIAVENRQVYVSDADSELWALDRRTGASLWKQDKLRRRDLTGPVVIGEYVGVGDFEGYIHLLTQAEGVIAGRVRHDSAGIQATPVALPGDRLLVLGAGGKLALYQLESVN
ncbi:MAG: outer membrane protein assembly factor BamB [Gammaproteobacteria bacterium]|nr:MAG: outer membrane protein assembly factor BamB [Gammaproteobacteria bacterium]